MHINNQTNELVILIQRNVSKLISAKTFGKGHNSL